MNKIVQQFLISFGFHHHADPFQALLVTSLTNPSHRSIEQRLNLLGVIQHSHPKEEIRRGDDAAFVQHVEQLGAFTGPIVQMIDQLIRRVNI